MTEDRGSAALQDGVMADSEATRHAYYTVGPLKFVLMSLTTFGLYELYWMYRNWKVIRDREQWDLSPFWRAFFAPLWIFSMGKIFAEQAKAKNTSITLPVTTLGGLYVLINLLWRIPDPWSLISFASFLPILPFDFAARRLDGQGDLAEPADRRYSGWMIGWLIVGSLLVVLVVIGTFFPEVAE